MRLECWNFAGGSPGFLPVRCRTRQGVNMLLATALNRLGAVAPLAVRVILGVLFIYHGLDKFDVGLDNVEAAFDMSGVPAPGVSAPAVAIFEIVGGIALILGLLTRIVAVLFIVQLVGALIYVKQDLGILSSEPMPGAELDLAYLGCLVVLVLLGPGWLSIDERLHLEPPVTLGGR
jgi:putative oxidoreductase